MPGDDGAFERGYGTRLATRCADVLLSSMPGYRHRGADRGVGTILPRRGVREPVVDILLNLRVVFRLS